MEFRYLAPCGIATHACRLIRSGVFSDRRCTVSLQMLVDCWTALRGYQQFAFRSPKLCDCAADGAPTQSRQLLAGGLFGRPP
jgi:hypothetical protein